MVILLVAIASYLIGSVSFAVVVSTVMGLADPRTYGSNNPGATNVLRSGNKTAAALTLCGDAFKGWLPVWLVTHFGGHYGLGDEAVAVAALAVFLGHLFPIFFRFKGGKGVGDGRRAVARHPLDFGRGDAGDLADHRSVLPLLVTGRIGFPRYSPLSSRW